jgi:hypothetical protein
MRDIMLNEENHEVAIVQKQAGNRIYRDFDIGDNSALIPLLMDFIKLEKDGSNLLIGSWMEGRNTNENRKREVYDFSRR